jgi:hypothetical protein
VTNTKMINVMLQNFNWTPTADFDQEDRDRVVEEFIAMLLMNPKAKQQSETVPKPRGVSFVQKLKRKQAQKDASEQAEKVASEAGAAGARSHSPIVDHYEDDSFEEDEAEEEEEVEEPAMEVEEPAMEVEDAMDEDVSEGDDVMGETPDHPVPTTPLRNAYRAGRNTRIDWFQP